MSIISAGGAVVGAGGPTQYEIERSLRFNPADSAFLSRTFGIPTNNLKWTMSMWLKRGLLSSHVSLFSAPSSGSSNFNIVFSASGGSGDGDFINYHIPSVGSRPFITNAVYRDSSAWYHFVFVFDSANATQADRFILYVNSERQSASTASVSLNQACAFNQSGVVGVIGKGTAGFGTVKDFFDGYMTEIHFIDGQALDETDFGEFSPTTGVWGPIAYTGTYGTNGFFLNFSDNSTIDALGTDFSGNGNTWDDNGFSVTAGAGNDSLVDTCTLFGTDTGIGGEVRGNYCTFNSVKPVTNSITYSNGNLAYKPGSSFSQTTYVEGTIGVLGGSTGKYYFEMSADQTGNLWTAGVALQNNTIGASNIGTTGSVMLYDTSKYVNGSETGSFLTQLSVNEVLGIALDTATGKVWFRDSGGFLGSGDPAAGTNEAGIPTGFSGATLVPVSQANSASTVTANFGQRPFAYTAPSGYKALVTTNLPDPTVIEGDEYFNTVLYTGTGASNARTGVGFQPDWVWIKERNATADHGLYDAVRGVQNQLESNTTTAETAEATGLTAFGADGFTVGALAQLNTSGDTYVAWNWKANGAGVSNTAGTISSTVSANTDSGFSIVTYTGTGVAGATVGHGLGAVPAMIIIKNRDDSASAFWAVYHKSAFVSGADPNVLYLNNTDAQADDTNVWGNSPSFTSTIFTLGDYNGSNGSGDDLVAYCFAAIPGYSAFGSYTGNGSADGPFVFLGFRPAFVMIKRSSASGNNWGIYDRLRANPFNVVNGELLASSSAAESTAFANFDFTSNGFKIRSSNNGENASGSTYIFMAFAENPFKFALAR